MYVIKTLESCRVSLNREKLKFLEKVELSVSDCGNNSFCIHLGCQPILNPRTGKCYSSFGDYNLIKKAIKDGNYDLEFDRD